MPVEVDILARKMIYQQIETIGENGVSITVSLRLRASLCIANNVPFWAVALTIPTVNYVVVRAIGSWERQLTGVVLFLILST
jgi:hypothetical protein